MLFYVCLNKIPIYFINNANGYSYVTTRLSIPFHGTTAQLEPGLARFLCL